MTYTIDYSDGTTFNIPVNTVNSDTSLDLPGKGYRNYGEAINENFLHLLENFAADDEPTNPVVGQLWYDKDAESLKVCDETSGSETFKTLFIYNEDNLSFTPDNSNRGLSVTGTQRYPQINLINRLDLSSDPNPTTPHRLSEVDFRFKNTADEDYYAGHLRFEIINATDNNERSRASLSVNTGNDQTNDWAGILFGYDDDSNTAGYGSVSIITAPINNGIDILLNGQSANFNVAIRPPLLDDDPSSTHSSEIHQSPQEGQIIYNTTSNKLKFYNGSSWNEIGSGGGSGSSTFIDLTDTPGSFTADRFLKVNSGGDAIEFSTLSSSSIPNLSASKITSGVFDPARLASGGSDGQYLKRTADGTEWSSVAGGSGVWNDGTSIYYNGSKNVGIGLTNPTHKLEVDGTISASGEITAYSDERLKENIENIDSPLDKVLNMRGVLYNKIGETEQKMGLIAQEVQEVIPQVVNEGEYLSISYGNLVGLLIEAIKELKEEVNNLKNQEIQ